MEYNEEIKDLLNSYHDKIEIEIMPELHKDFTKLHLGVSELCGKLKNKGLLKEDPYFKGSEIIELMIPSTEQFSEADSTWKVAERITHFESILSFITHNYNFSLNTFNFNELEKIKKFLDFYIWKDLTNPMVSDFNTQSFGKLIIGYRHSTGDTLMLKTFDNCLDGIIKNIDFILNKLKIILIYLKESYKLFIREDLLPIVKDKNPNISSDKILVSICNEIKDNYSYLKLSKKYIEEVINEEFSSDGKDLKEEVIKKLTVTSKINNSNDKKNKIKEVDPEKNLLILLMEIGKVRGHLAVSIEKLFVNHNSLKSQEGNFITKLLNNLSQMLFNITPKTIYPLRLKSVNGGSREVNLHFEKFYDEIKKLEFELLNFAEEDKTRYYINNKNSMSINPTIDKLLMSIKKQIALLITLDEYLKYELKLKGIKAKGIKPELTVLRTLVNSATAKYSEYLTLIDGK